MSECSNGHMKMKEDVDNASCLHTHALEHQSAFSLSVIGVGWKICIFDVVGFIDFCSAEEESVMYDMTTDSYAVVCSSRAFQKHIFNVLFQVF